MNNAVRNGSMNNVRRFIRSNTTNQTTLNQALMTAISWSRTQVVPELIQAGANVNFRDNNGLTPLILAAYEGRTRIVPELIQAGANVNAQTNNGNTALIEAVVWGRLQIVRDLIRAGANVNARDSDGDTALIDAAKWSRTQIAHELIRAGANVNSRDNDGRTALVWAASWGRTQIVRELLKAGAKNWRTAYNRTRNQAVHNAIKNYASKVITSGMRTAATRRRVAAIATLMKKTPINRGLTTRIMSTLKRS